MALAPAGPASAMLTSEVLFSFLFQAALGHSAVYTTSVIGAAVIMLSVGGMMLAQKQGGKSASTPSTPSTPATRIANEYKHAAEEKRAFTQADSAAIAHEQDMAELQQEDVVSASRGTSAF